MHSDMMNNQKEMTRMRHAYEHDARSRGLKKNWFVGLVVLWIAIWAFVGASGLMPRPLWAVILGLMVVAAFAIALFGPRIGQSKTH